MAKIADTINVINDFKAGKLPAITWKVTSVDSTAIQLLYGNEWNMNHKNVEELFANTSKIPDWLRIPFCGTW